jgi:hypothetical protein
VQTENIPSEVETSETQRSFILCFPFTSSTGKANVQKKESAKPSFFHKPLQIGNKVFLFGGTSRNRLGSSELFAFSTEMFSPSLHQQGKQTFKRKSHRYLSHALADRQQGFPLRRHLQKQAGHQRALRLRQRDVPLGARARERGAALRQGGPLRRPAATWQDARLRGPAQPAAERLLLVQCRLWDGERFICLSCVLKVGFRGLGFGVCYWDAKLTL